MKAKKKHFKIIVLAIILLLACVPVTASQNIFKLVQVHYSILVNGIELESELPVLNYEGTTYIPLRKVSEATGADVQWDDYNRRVIIKTAEADVSKSIDTLKIYSTTMHYYGSLNKFSGGIYTEYLHLFWI